MQNKKTNTAPQEPEATNFINLKRPGKTAIYLDPTKIADFFKALPEFYPGDVIAMLHEIIDKYTESYPDTGNIPDMKQELKLLHELLYYFIDLDTFNIHHNPEVPPHGIYIR